MPDTYNWKGYWGREDGVRILHWHGPKPERCLPCYMQHRGRPFWAACRHTPGRSPIGCSKNHWQLLRWSVDRTGSYYAVVLQQFKHYQQLAGALELGKDVFPEDDVVLNSSEDLAEDV